MCKYFLYRNLSENGFPKWKFFENINPFCNTHHFFFFCSLVGKNCPLRRFSFKEMGQCLIIKNHLRTYYAAHFVLKWPLFCYLPPLVSFWTPFWLCQGERTDLGFQLWLVLNEMAILLAPTAKNRKDNTLINPLINWLILQD